MNGDHDTGTSDGARRDAVPDGATRTVPADEPTTEYLGGVRSALADLPASEVEEILDDVRAHLADLAGELGSGVDRTALTARLGTPATYAAELRAAAGYPPAPAPQQEPAEVVRPDQARLAVVGLALATLLLAAGGLAMTFGPVALGALLAVMVLPIVVRDGPGVATVAALPEVRQLATAVPAAGGMRTVADFVASLQPAWWLARAVVATWLVVGLFGVIDILPLVVVGALALPVSVWLGYRARRDRRWLWLVVPLNGLAAAIVLAAGWLWTPAFESPSPVSYSSSPSPPGLWQDGQPIRDIRPVDASGNPLSGVYLFDQDGRPIDTWGSAECLGGEDAYSMPGDPAAVRPYPRGTLRFEPDRGCVTTPPGPLVVAVPSDLPPPPVPASTSPPAPTTTPVPGPPEPAPPVTTTPAPPTG